jgi:uncharacterized protein YjbJ (UPF0337 family)
VKKLPARFAENPLQIKDSVRGPILARLCWSHDNGRETKIQQRSNSMNQDQIKGKFKQLAGEIKRKWGKVTDDDLTEAQGSMEKLVGKIQERSGDQREAIEKWLKSQGV